MYTVQISNDNFLYVPLFGEGVPHYQQGLEIAMVADHLGGYFLHPSKAVELYTIMEMP